MSHLTDDEVQALQSSGLPRATPYIITGASQGPLSIARHYGGIAYQGARYIYIPPTDELVRDDVLKWLAKRRMSEAKAAFKAERDAAMNAQLEL